MRSEEQLEELQRELAPIKWDIVGLSETRLPGESTIDLKSGHVLYHKNSDTEDHIGGVGFIINKHIKHYVDKLQSISDRVIYIVLRLNTRYRLQIIHVYAPTNAAEDENVEQVYEDIRTARQKENAHFLLVTGDFNAKIGNKTLDDTEYIGNYGLGVRNSRGEMLANFLNAECLYCLNTFYKKPLQRKWTWISPDKNVKNEIDFILSNNRKICKDVSVINRVHTGSDHRLVRAHVKINIKLERNKLIKQQRYPVNKELIENKDQYQKELNSRLDTNQLPDMDINQLNEKITHSIQTSTKKICSKKRKTTNGKITPSTMHLIRERRTLKRETDEYREKNKQVKREIRRDLRRYRTKTILNTIEENASMKILKSKLSKGKQRMTKLKNKQNVEVSSAEEIAKVVEEFYTELYTSYVSQLAPRTQINVINAGSEEIPEISTEEIRAALKKMKNGKCPGEDRITAEMLKHGGNALEKALQILLNKCLHESKIPEKWYNSEVVILFKKGDMTNIENYRPISLLSVLYKLFTKILTNRLNNKFDFYQPVEQAGFRTGYSTIDHLQTLRTLIEKTTEYNIPIHLAFIDFHKAFDSIETRYILDSMDNARIDCRYTEVIKNIYKNATMHVKINDNLKTNQINIKRGVRQGDTISPKLFTLVLEDVFKKLQWQTKGIKIDGSFLNHLRFADDIVLISSDIHELAEMTKELNQASKQVGLKMNIQKTKIMSEVNIDVTIDNQQIENVSQYVYLGHNITLGKENQRAEITRRIALAWAAFGKLTYILKNPEVPINLKRKVYNSCILPVATYGLETMALTVKSASRLRVTQRAMERAMLNISLRDKIRNVEIRRRTKVNDVMEEIAANKWRWAGHVARQDSNRWTLKTLQWRPRETKRSRGRPQRRWVDDIRETAGRNWMRQARDRQAWKNMEEAYIQEWMEKG